MNGASSVSILLFLYTVCMLFMKDCLQVDSLLVSKMALVRHSSLKILYVQAMFE